MTEKSDGIDISGIDEKVKEALLHLAESISTAIYNIDILYELIYAIVKYPTLVLTKDENGNIIDVELKMPKIDQELLQKYAAYVFDLKDTTKNSKVIEQKEILTMLDKKLEELIKNG